MKCPSCGYESLEGVKFCSRCGIKLEGQTKDMTTAVPWNVPPQVEGFSEQPAMNYQVNNMVTSPMGAAPTGIGAKKRPSKKVVLLSSAVLLVGILITVLILIFKKSNQDYRTISSNYMTHAYLELENENCMFYFTYGGKIIQTDQTYSELKYSFGNTACAFTNIDQELFYVSSNGCILVAEEVEYFMISDDGTGLAYVRDVDDSGGELYLYDSKTKKSKVIAKDVYDQSLCLSPDGDTIAFVAEYDNDYEFRSYLSVNKKDPEPIGKGLLPVAVSNDASYLYYLDESKLYVKTKKDLQKLTNYFSGDMMLNQSYSQALFRDDSKTYLSIKGGEKQKISNDRVYGVITADTIITHYVSTPSSLKIIGIDSFQDKLLDMDGDGYYLNSKLETHQVFDYHIDYHQVSEDGKSLIYSKYDSLYLVSDLGNSKSIPKQIAKDIDIEGFVASKDLSYIYYTNYDDELLCIKASGKPKKIADDVEDSDYYLDTTDDTLYFLVDASYGTGTLYYSQSGGAKKKIKGAEDVSLGAISHRYYYTLENDEETLDLYLLKGGKSSCVLKGIND